MARIRTIKPEFFSSSQVVRCSVNARMLFVGMWCFADDHGVHPDDAHRLKMEVFPGDALSVDDVQQMLDELIGARLIQQFQAGDGDWLCVPTWKRHQRIDKPTFKHPTPPDKFDERSSSPPRDIAEPSPPPHPRIGREGIGKEGIQKGMEEKSAISRAESSVDDGTGIDSDGDNAPPLTDADTPPPQSRDANPDVPQAAELMAAWNAIDGVPHVNGMTEKRQRAVAARMRDAKFRDGWREAITKVATCDFLKGGSSSGWKASLDWFLKPDSFLKILEGAYDDGNGTRRSGGSINLDAGQVYSGD